MAKKHKKLASEKRAVRSFEVEAKKMLVTEQRGLQRYYWGTNDRAPQELFDVISQSGTAMQCVEKLHAYTLANGFVNEELNRFRVNSLENAANLLSVSAYEASIFKGFAWRVLYNNAGVPAMAYHYPLRHVRKRLDGRFIYNHRMYEQYYLQGEDVIMDAFDPSKSPAERRAIIADDIKKYGYQRGEILFKFRKTPFLKGDIYPIAKAYSAIEDIMTDAKIQDIESNKADGKYNSDIVISRVKSQTNNSLPPYTSFDESGQAPDLPNPDEDFDNAVLDFQEGKAKILDLSAESKEGMPEIDSFNTESYDALDKAYDRVARKVCRLFDTPPVIIGFDVAAMLGNQQAMSNALKAYNETLKPAKELLKEAFTDVWPQFDWTITTNNLFEYLPEEVLAEMTSDELRKYGGVGEVSTEMTEQTRIIELLKSMDPQTAGKLVDKMDAKTIGILLGVKQQEVQDVTN